MGVRDQLTGLGFEASVRPTGAILSSLRTTQRRLATPGRTCCSMGTTTCSRLIRWIYGKSPPFDPQLVDGPHGKRFVARGAVDDKGQAMMFVEAMRAWKDATGAIPANITALIEGEEEVGSPSLEPFLIDNKQELAADVALISDTGMWTSTRPPSARCCVAWRMPKLTLKAANRDLHSGLFGVLR